MTNDSLQKIHVIWFILKHLYENFIFNYNFWIIACLWTFQKHAIACATKKYRQYSTLIRNEFDNRAIKFLMRIHVRNGTFLCIFCSWYMLVHSLFHPKMLKFKYMQCYFFFKLMFPSSTYFRLKIKLHEQKSTPITMYSVIHVKCTFYLTTSLSTTNAVLQDTVLR